MVVTAPQAQIRLNTFMKYFYEIFYLSVTPRTLLMQLETFHETPTCKLSLLPKIQAPSKRRKGGCGWWAWVKLSPFTPFLFSFKGQTDQERGGKGPKTVENGTIETSLNIEMTDKTFETADFSTSEKQVRFSMKTIRTPPASPKPASTTSRFNKTKMASKPTTTINNYNPAGRKPPVTNQHNDSEIDPVDKIKVNFLEKLEILPESKA